MEWNSVSDSKPKNFERVIVHMPGKSWSEGRYKVTVFRHEKPYGTDKEVTHWAELPLAPDEAPELWTRKEDGQPGQNREHLVFIPSESRDKIQIAYYVNGFRAPAINDDFTHWMPLPDSP